jgi:hypothetical protein
MIERSRLQPGFVRPAATFATFVTSLDVALAATTFTGVAAGDMSTNDAILSTRTIDPGTGEPSATTLTARPNPCTIPVFAGSGRGPRHTGQAEADGERCRGGPWCD